MVVPSSARQFLSCSHFHGSLPTSTTLLLRHRRLLQHRGSCRTEFAPSICSRAAPSAAFRASRRGPSGAEQCRSRCSPRWSDLPLAPPAPSLLASLLNSPTWPCQARWTGQVERHGRSDQPPFRRFARTAWAHRRVQRLLCPLPHLPPPPWTLSKSTERETTQCPTRTTSSTTPRRADRAFRSSTLISTPRRSTSTRRAPSRPASASAFCHKICWSVSGVKAEHSDWMMIKSLH